VLLAIRSKVEALPERQRLGVVMHKYQQMDYKPNRRSAEVERVGDEVAAIRAYETLREQLKEFI